MGRAVEDGHYREGPLQKISSSSVIAEMKEQFGDLVELDEEQRGGGWVGMTQRGQKGNIQLHCFLIPKEDREEEGEEGMRWRRGGEGRPLLLNEKETERALRIELKKVRRRNDSLTNLLQL
jgi:hypothetical protein